MSQANLHPAQAESAIEFLWPIVEVLDLSVLGCFWSPASDTRDALAYRLLDADQNQLGAVSRQASGWGASHTGELFPSPHQAIRYEEQAVRKDIWRQLALFQLHLESFQSQAGLTWRNELRLLTEDPEPFQMRAHVMSALHEALRQILLERFSVYLAEHPSIPRHLPEEAPSGCLASLVFDDLQLLIRRPQWPFKVALGHGQTLYELAATDGFLESSSKLADSLSGERHPRLPFDTTAGITSLAETDLYRTIDGFLFEVIARGQSTGLNEATQAL